MNLIIKEGLKFHIFVLDDSNNSIRQVMGIDDQRTNVVIQKTLALEKVQATMEKVIERLEEKIKAMMPKFKKIRMRSLTDEPGSWNGKNDFYSEKDKDEELDDEMEKMRQEEMGLQSEATEREEHGSQVATLQMVDISAWQSKRLLEHNKNSLFLLQFWSYFLIFFFTSIRCKPNTPLDDDVEFLFFNSMNHQEYQES